MTQPVAPGRTVDDLVLLVTWDGHGFENPTALPQFAVFEDGYALVSSLEALAASYVIDQAERIPIVFEYWLGADGLADVVMSLDEAGLPAPTEDFGFANASGVGFSLFHTQADGPGLAVTRIYGLGVAEDGLSAQQQQARNVLADLLRRLTAQAAEVATPYQPSAIAVFYEDRAITSEQEIEWPLETTPILEYNSCVLVEGDEAAALSALVTGPTPVWLIGDAAVKLHFRPLWPHETACP